MAEDPDPMIIQGRPLQGPAAQGVTGDHLHRIGRQKGGDCGVLCERRPVDEPTKPFEAVDEGMVPSCIMRLLPTHRRS